MKIEFKLKRKLENKIKYLEEIKIGIDKKQ